MTSEEPGMGRALVLGGVYCHEFNSARRIESALMEGSSDPGLAGRPALGMETVREVNELS